MGIYLHFYAVNVPRFEPFLDQSLASVLLYHLKYAVRNPNKSEEPHYRIAGPQWPQHYYSFPERGGIKVQKRDQGLTDLTEEAVFTETFLATTVKNYLTKNSSSDLADLLDALESCPDANAVRTLSNGWRRWWIGSFLDYVDLNHYASPGEYTRLVSMFHKVLRNVDCGKDIPDNPYRLLDLEFPVLPEEDVDFYMGAWTPEEVKFFTSLIHKLFAQQTPIFSTPPLTRAGHIQRGWSTSELAEEDSEFNQAVHSVLNELLQVEATGFDNPAIVSFMG